MDVHSLANPIVCERRYRARPGAIAAGIVSDSLASGESEEHLELKDAIIQRPCLVLLRHKLQRTRPFILRRDRRFDLAPQHGQRDRRSTSLAMSRRRMVAIEFGTCRSGRSGGSSGSVTFGKGKFREENFGNRS